MHRSKLSIGALLAAGLTGLFAADASAQTPSPPTTETEAKVEVRPGPLDLVVYFRAGGSDIDTASNSSLDELAVWLREDRSRTVFIEEHPDEAKAASFDVKLGTNRSEATRRYLVAHGAMDSQIKVVAHGQVSAAKAGDLNTRTIFVSTSGGAMAEGAVTGEAGIGASAGVGDTGASAGAGTTEATEPDEPLYTPPVVKEDDKDSDDHLITPFGMSLAVGGGLMNFFDQDTRDLTGPAGTWEARLTIGTRSPLAFEAAYVGSAQNVNALGLDNSAYLLGTSFEGDARLIHHHGGPAVHLRRDRLHPVRRPERRLQHLERRGLGAPRAHPGRRRSRLAVRRAPARRPRHSARRVQRCDPERG
jgi:hypothetical protein